MSHDSRSSALGIQSLRRAASCPFLIASLALASWPGVAATQEDAGGGTPSSPAEASGSASGATEGSIDPG
jgi:hypothetical protein